MDIQALKSRTRQVAVEYEGEKLTVEYRPGALTGALVDRVSTAAGEQGQSAVIALALSEVVAGWDATCGGEPFPPSMENLMALPLRLLSEVFRVVVQDAAPPPPSAGSSGSF